MKPVIPTSPQVLTDRQVSFCEAYVEQGLGNAAEAAREAGYSTETARQTGYKLLLLPHVASHINELTLKLLASSSPIAVRTMRDLAMNARSEFVRQSAAADILDRTGFKPPDRHQHLVSGSVTVSIDLGD